MWLVTKQDWEDADALIRPQITADGNHVWPFDPSLPVDVRFFRGSRDGIPMNRHDYYELLYLVSGELPLAASAAAATLDSEVRAADFRREYSRRTRRDMTARDAHDHARARQAADEEARGAGVTLLGLYVTVTVTDPGLLSRAAADTEASAETSKIRLQRLYRSQAAAFTATLPCGVCLPELAGRLRH